MVNLLDRAEVAPFARARRSMFCRNVFIYFSDAAVRRVVEHVRRRDADARRICASARPNRCCAPPTRFELEEIGGAFVYVKRDGPIRKGMAMPDIVRVLVVDDSAYVRKVVTQMLSRSPFIEVVGTARDGDEALELVASCSPTSSPAI